MKRSAPVLKQISALLALLVAAFVTAPAGALTAERTAFGAFSGTVSDSAALPGKQLLARASAEDEKGSPGGGDALFPAASPQLSAPSSDRFHARAPSAGRRPATTASYRARAPPAG